MLRDAAPDYEGWHEARTLTRGAEIVLRTQLDDPRKPVPIALRDRLANVLAARPPERRARIVEAVDDYRSDLEALGVSDADVQARISTGGLMVSLVLQMIAAVLLLPFAVVGALVNLVPALIVRAVGLARLSPSMQATVKPGAAILAFGITWGLVVAATFNRFGLGRAAAAVVLLPVYLAAVIFLTERVALMWRLIRRWQDPQRRTATERGTRRRRPGGAVAVNDWLWFLVAVVPLLVIRAWALWDDARSRHDLRLRSRVLWAVALIALPVIALAAYLVSRPPRDRRQRPLRNENAEDAASVVDVAERHQRGELTDDEYRSEIRSLTGRAG